MVGGRRLFKLARDSRITAGRLEIAGIPAILIGVSGIIVATGVARALVEGAHTMPDVLREAKLLIEVSRGSRERALRP